MRRPYSTQQVPMFGARNPVQNVVITSVMSVALGGFTLAYSYALYQAHQRLDAQLAPVHENKVARVQLRISSIAVYTSESIQFDAQVLSSMPTGGIPSIVRVRWPVEPSVDKPGDSEQAQGQSQTKLQNQEDLQAKVQTQLLSHPHPESPIRLGAQTQAQAQPLVRPGQVWQMSLQLKSPHGLINPGGFDYETYLFREGVRVLGTVRGTPRLLHNYQAGSSDTAIQAMRHDVRAAMQTYLQDKRYGPVIMALVMGDQSSISAQDWQLFNRTGMTHLVSISGSHITMLSSLVMMIMMLLWPYCSWRGKSLGDRRAGMYWAGGVGVIVALAYCLLAGWGIPAQRTFLMLALFYACSLWRIPLSISHLFLLVALVVLYLDPWAILAPGFYLSFAAVAVLRHLMLQLLIEPHEQNRGVGLKYLSSLTYKLSVWWRVQLLITLVLAPFLLIFFQQVSIISPLVNAYAILLVGAVVTPMALCLGLLALWSPYPYLTQLWADVCHGILAGVMRLTEYLAQFPWANLNLPGASNSALGLAFAGVLLLVLPKGLPFKSLSFLLLVPAFALRPHSLQAGDWQAWALDLGQASGIIVRTAQHTLVFDTGVKTQLAHDSATRVLIPSLRYLGLPQIDTLVVSHTDSDHSGGFASLISEWPVQHAYASFRLDDFLLAQEQLWEREFTPMQSQLSYQACQSGHRFERDGVSFQFLFPEAQTHILKQAGNEHSCVLLIQGRKHSLLLTGDILREQEERYDWPAVNVVVAAHHGSHTSSSEHFIQQTQPQHVIVQSGYQNRFGHPHQAVVRRWLDRGSRLWNTAQQGAIVLRSSYQGLQVQALREEKARYWHH